MRLERSPFSERGFSLAETLVAVAILGAVAMGVAQLFGVAAHSNQVAKVETSAATLAMKKMEGLRSLTWGFDTTGMGLPLTDTTTDLSVDPATANGAGLNPSPAGTLDGNVQGYFDYVAPDGTWTSNQDGQPNGGLYLRRWAISPLPTNPNNTLIFQVYVTTVARAAAHDPTRPVSRLPGDAWLVAVKTRKAQ